MANSSHDHEHDSHAHDGHEPTHDEHGHDHFHGAGNVAPAHGHAHGEPTGKTIEKIGFTRSQFLRMCLTGVAAGAASARLAPGAPAVPRSTSQTRTAPHSAAPV